MAFILLVLFTISYFLHMTARIPALGALHLDLILGGGALVAIIFRYGKDSLRLDEKTSRSLNRFLLYIFISLPFVTWPGSVIKLHLTDWIKVALFFVLVVGAVRSENQLKLFMIVFVGCQLFRVLEPLYLHITEGYWGDIAYSHVGGGMSGLNRLGGAPNDVVNSTQLGWVTVGTIPFLYYMLWQGNKLGKLFFLVLLFPVLNVMLLTGARSGLLSFGAVIFGIILLTKKRARNMMIAIVLLLPLAMVMMGRLSPEMQTRYLSLIDSNVAGADTRQGRINGMIRQLGTISHNPLFGNGLNTSREVNWNVTGISSQITHNLYIEILQCTGIIGFTIFMLFIVSMVRSLKETHQILQNKGYGTDDWLWRVTAGVFVWVIMDILYAFSCFGLMSWEWYFFGGVATVCHVLANDRKPFERATDRQEEVASAV